MAKEKIVIRPILPKDPQFFVKAGEELVAQVTATLTGPVAKTLKSAQEDFIRDWEHAPNIDTVLTVQKTQIKLWVGPKGTNKRYWVFVSEGTRGKTIRPIRASTLNVRYGYSPKTRPGGGKGTGMYSGPFRRAMEVDWPGIQKPRKFEERVVKKHEKSIILLVTRAAEKVLRKYNG